MPLLVICAKNGGPSPGAGFEFSKLGGGLVASGAQFGGVEFDNRLAGFQGVSLGSQHFLHSAAVARSGAYLIGLNRSRNAAGAGGGISAASPGQESQRDHPEHNEAEFDLHAPGR